jgi:hypothetical protein
MQVRSTQYYRLMQEPGRLMIVEAWKLSGDWRADSQGRWNKNSIVWLTPGLSPVAQGCFGKSNGLTNTLHGVSCIACAALTLTLTLAYTR